MNKLIQPMLLVVPLYTICSLKKMLQDSDHDVVIMLNMAVKQQSLSTIAVLLTANTVTLKEHSVCFVMYI